jgi:hypothetical protein
MVRGHPKRGHKGDEENAYEALLEVDENNR